jgi:hypothetical protein
LLTFAALLVYRRQIRLWLGLEKQVNDRPTDPKADLRETEPLPGAQIADTLLARALRRAWWTILWERLWPALASLGVAVGIFLAASWAGLWLWLPPMGRAVALFGLIGLVAVAAVPLFRFRLPSTFDGLRRLDRGSGIAHRPATALADELAHGERDQVSLALWRAHVEQALRAANALRPGRRVRACRCSIRSPCARWCCWWSAPRSSRPPASACGASRPRSTGPASCRRRTSASTPG